MRKVIWLVIALTAVALSTMGADGCDSVEREAAYDQAQENREKFVPYIPKNGVEGSNYNRIQEIADDPSSVLWCTSFPPSSTAPIVTVPIVGKLTSSSVSAFGDGDSSVDGLYHGSPPPYRFGFTPGGQLVVFENIPTICTTAVNSFQRKSISVSVDDSLTAATQQAEDALKDVCKDNNAGSRVCTSAKAQAILEAAAGQ